MIGDALSRDSSCDTHVAPRLKETARLEIREHIQEVSIVALVHLREKMNARIMVDCSSLVSG